MYIRMRERDRIAIFLAADRCGMDASDWARQVLMDAANQVNKRRKPNANQPD